MISTYSALILRSREAASRRMLQNAPPRLPASLDRTRLGFFGAPAVMRKQDGCWLYIVECSDGSFYTGTSRGEIEARISQHNAGLHPGSYTFTRRPVTLAFAEHFPNILDAIAMERRVKGWSRRKKQAMIDGRWEQLPEFARRLT